MNQTIQIGIDMKHIRATLAALAFGLAALPALAGSFAIDLPRLDFPGPVTTGTDGTRACTLPLLPGAPGGCVQAGN